MLDPHAVPPIRRRLAGSLRHIGDVMTLDPALAADVSAVAQHLERGGALQPDAYGRYFALVRALQSGDGGAALAHLRAVAASPLEHTAPVEIRMLGLDGFDRPRLREAKGHFVSDSLRSEQLRPIPLAAHPRIRRRLTSAMALIRHAAPASWRDFSGTTTEIIAAYGVIRGRSTFDGCSSLERHGSILVNMKRTRTPLVLAETLVHESAHSLLFALSCDEHRVLNPPTERHKSPLRIDPRPLDGIYHAAFVLSRMHGFLAEVAAQPEVPAAMRGEARKVMKVRRENFMDGYSVLAAHARFTESGRALIEDARARVERAEALSEAAA